MTENEFSRLENLTLLAGGGETLHFEASQKEGVALAKRADIPAVKSLTADLKVISPEDGVYQIEGELKGRVVLQSARTLEEFETLVEDRFSEGFIEKRKLGKKPPEEAEAYEEYEVFDGEEVDLGEVVAQLLILSIDPFPHPEDENLEENLKSGVRIIGEKEAKAKESPFSELKKLQKKA